MPNESERTRDGAPVPGAASWAKRLAQQQQRIPEAHTEDGQSLLLDAAEALWLPFDTAVREANTALEQAGEPARISITRTSHERQYATEGPDGSQRSISAYLVLSIVDGHLSGGAYIGTNRSRLSMYLTPKIVAGSIQWVVASSHRSFSSEMVHDLFLSVFADDPAATHRLSPLSGDDHFETPWA